MIRPQPTADPGSARWDAAVAAALLVVIAVMFLPVLHLGFWGEDFFFLRQAHAAQHHPEVLLRRWVEPFNRPLTQAAFFLEFRRWGLWPAGYLLDRLLLHALNSLLLYVLLRRLLGRGTAAGAALLFAAGVGFYGKALMDAVFLGDSLSTFFLLATGVAAGAGAGSPRRGGQWLGGWGAAVLFALALGCKESAIMALVMCAGLVWVRGRGWAAAVRTLLPLALVAVAYGVVQMAGGSGVAAVLRGPQERLLSAPIQGLRLATLMLLPVQPASPLLGSAPAAVRAGVGVLHAARPYLGLALLAAGLVWLWRGPAAVRWLVATFFAFLLPFGLIPLEGDWLQIRYAYLPATMFCGLLALIVRWLWARRTRWGKLLAVVILAAALAGDAVLVRALAAKYRAMSRAPENLQELRALQALRRSEP